MVSIAGVAFLAGVQQAGDQYSQFGQGAQGYAKRFGAGYADAFVSTFLSGAIFPSLLKQDLAIFTKGFGRSARGFCTQSATRSCAKAITDAGSQTTQI